MITLLLLSKDEDFDALSQVINIIHLILFLLLLLFLSGLSVVDLIVVNLLSSLIHSVEKVVIVKHLCYFLHLRVPTFLINQNNIFTHRLNFITLG